MAAQEEPSKPQNPYWLWLSANREALTKEAGSGKGSVVGKLAGEKWKSLSAVAKAPFEKKAEEAKANYAKAMEEFREGGGVPGKRRQDKAAAKSDKAAKKCKKDSVDPNRPTKPQNAYWLWLSANRDALTKEAGTGKGSVVGKLAGARWKSLSEVAKAPFEKKAEEAKIAYTEAMEEYRKSLPVGVEADEQDGDEDDDEEGNEGSASSPQPAAKTAKSPAPQESNGAVLSEAKTLGYMRQLKAIMENKKMLASPEKALAALKESGGSVIKAKAALFGA